VNGAGPLHRFQVDFQAFVFKLDVAFQAVMPILKGRIHPLLFLNGLLQPLNTRSPFFQLLQFGLAGQSFKNTHGSFPRRAVVKCLVGTAYVPSSMA
jgi:hypothetical protein